MERVYDAIVIGGGSTGENVAQRVRRGGLDAAVVESERVGGECSYWACMPSKALLRPLRAIQAARGVPGAREAMTGEVEVAAVLRRRDAVASHWDDASQVRWLAQEGIDLLRGHARLVGERRVEVTPPAGASVTLVARQAVAICSGSAAAIPPIPGLRDAKPWTAREATSAQRAPRRLAILGGGVVACEMATAWAGLGAREVTLLERGPRLLRGVEPFAAEAVSSALTAHGVQIRTGVGLTAVRRATSGEIDLTLDGGEHLVADELLVAAGRSARTEDIGLETVGLAPGAWLDTDDSLRVRGVDGGWLYAAGDVNHRALLTHMGKYQARACGDAIVAAARGEALDAAPWGRHVATADALAVPQVIFTDPEVAAVGLREEVARDRGLSVRCVDYEIGRVAGASLHAEGYAGRARIVIDEKRRVIVGATFVGPDVAELLQAATIAIVGAVPLERLWHAVPAYPTVNEIWLRLLEAAGL